MKRHEKHRDIREEETKIEGKGQGHGDGMGQEHRKMYPNRPPQHQSSGSS